MNARRSPREAPVLQTPRLVLRPHRPADWDAGCALWGDADVVRYIGGRALGREEVWARLIRYAGLWPWLGYGYWAVDDRVTGALVGELGFMDARRAIDPPLGDVPEAGWIVGPRFQGQGLAAEALGEVLRWADRELSAERTACIIHPDHHRSLRLAQAHGYVVTRMADYGGALTTVLERRRGG